MVLETAAAAAAAWAAGLAVVAQAQDRLIFGSPRSIRWAPSGPHLGHSTEEVTIETADGETLRGWLTQPSGVASRLAVWFGGRNEHVGWVPKIATWLGPHWALCTFAYRGCSGSTGRPSERVCVEDAQAIVDWAMAAAGVSIGQALLLGRSLGSCIAMQLAARHAAAGLVLLSPPASIRALASRNPLLLPVVPWMRSPFDSMARAHQVRSPVLMLLAESDRRVPHRDSLRLADAIRLSRVGPAEPACRIVTVPGTDHRTLARDPQALAAIASFAGGLQD